MNIIKKAKYKAPNERTKDFVKNIRDYFEQKNNKILYDKRNIIKIIEYENQKYVVKSFKIPHLLNQIVYRFWRDSKAKRSFENSVHLRRIGINTPEPIGYIEFPTRFKFLESFYISKLFDFDFEIRAVFRDLEFADRENILKRFIEFSYNLHKKGVYHIDYSPGNILVKKIDKKYTFSIIDVNRMKFVKLDNRLKMKSLSKLTKNSKDNEFMAKYYAKISKIDERILLKNLKIAVKEEQKYLDNKKRLKRFKS